MKCMVCDRVVVGRNFVCHDCGDMNPSKGRKMCLTCAENAIIRDPLNPRCPNDKCRAYWSDTFWMSGLSKRFKDHIESRRSKLVDASLQPAKPKPRPQPAKPSKLSKPLPPPASVKVEVRTVTDTLRDVRASYRKCPPQSEDLEEQIQILGELLSQAIRMREDYDSPYDSA